MAARVPTGPAPATTALLCVVMLSAIRGPVFPVMYAAHFASISKLFTASVTDRGPSTSAHSALHELQQVIR